MCILISCRIFTATTGSTIDSNLGLSSSLVAFLIGFLFDIIAILPFFILTKTNNTSIIDSLSKQNTTLSKILSFIICVLFSTVAGATISLFSRFVCNWMPDINPWAVTFLITLCASYGAFVGIEPLGRFSFLAVVLTFLSLVAVFFMLLPHYKLFNFHLPFENGTTPVLLQGIFQGGSLFEILSVMLIYKNVKSNRKKGYIWFLILTLISIQLIIFLIGATLGDYTSSTTYPFYALVKSLNARIDSIYVALWTVLGFIRISYFILLSKTTFSFSFKKSKYPLTMSVIFTLLSAGVFLLKPQLVTLAVSLLKYIALFSITIIPLLILLLRKRRVLNENK